MDYPQNKILYQPMFAQSTRSIHPAKKEPIIIIILKNLKAIKQKTIQLQTTTYAFHLWIFRVQQLNKITEEEGHTLENQANIDLGSKENQQQQHYHSSQCRYH